MPLSRTQLSVGSNLRPDRLTTQLLLPVFSVTAPTRDKACIRIEVTENKIAFCHTTLAWEGHAFSLTAQLANLKA